MAALERLRAEQARLLRTQEDLARSQADQVRALAAREQLAQAQAELERLRRAEPLTPSENLAMRQQRRSGVRIDQRMLENPLAAEGPEVWPSPDAPQPLTGELAKIEHALGSCDPQGALVMARAWHAKQPGDVLALIGLGDALEATHALGEAARIYGSIIDLYPSRADLRRFAGERLEDRPYVIMTDHAYVDLGTVSR